ncbi:PLP-dependent aminotransferase family protein [Pectobacterium polonicum]|uniref:PLP-dependent aminotransferase family protein n=1 Tax=Pectobacterium polonicum TaxID=2485124 RepID=A0ABV1P4B6_9GAMM|nr:PLP-dependent aminotransferase family protein [Pectobacterium polonicum]MDC9818870.1 PLP-dependent aminotransferase family protein [Pectobacterium polonicum]
MDVHQLKPNRTLSIPMYLQLYQRFQEAIANGTLKPEERVPSVRNLASQLNLARGTIEQAYQMLVSEGYFVTRGAAGTVISPELTVLSEHRKTQRVEDTAHNVLHTKKPEVHNVMPFQLGLPALDAFPRKTWTRLAGRNLRTLEVLEYPDPAGYEPLRQVIATYVGISRGISCSHDQVFITNGYSGALALICHTLLQSGDMGWYEDPGYLVARQYLEHARMHLVPVPVDNEGINVNMGKTLAPEARFAIITPTHQSPTGVTLSLPRRLELLNWAKQQQAWIIEDDYDSEFRYHGRPLPAVKSLDHGDRVIYVGTFSKVLFPGLRLAYMVVPTMLVEHFKHSVKHFPSSGSVFLQATVSDFMQQGYFVRHLRKMRSLYAIRHDYLVDAINKILSDSVYVNPQAGGIHILAHLQSTQSDKTISQRALSQGLGVQALSDWSIKKATQGGLLMGFTNFTTFEDAMLSIRSLEKIIKNCTI